MSPSEQMDKKTEGNGVNEVEGWSKVVIAAEMEVGNQAAIRQEKRSGGQGGKRNDNNTDYCMSKSVKGNSRRFQITT